MRKISLSISTLFMIVILLLTTTEASIGINSNDKISTSTQSTNSTQTVFNIDAKTIVQNVNKSVTKIQQPGIDENGIVTFNDKYFGYMHYEVEENPRKYNGKEVVITGFVYKSPDFKENEFKVARMASSFCADDAYVLGLMCLTEDADDFEHRQWVTVKGTLVFTSYKNSKSSFEYGRIYLKPTSIEKIQMRPDYYLY